VRLYNLSPGGPAASSVQVEAASVELFEDVIARAPLAHASTGRLSAAGTGVPFNAVRARVVKVRLDRVSGTFAGQPAAGLAEIEVIARGEAATPTPLRR
jgi:hypothetical protein